MKIVHGLGWYFPDHVGGTEVYVAALARIQREHGYEIVVAAPAAGARKVQSYEHDGIPVFRYPIATPATRDEAQGLVRVRGAERFAEWLMDTRPDVYHQHSVTTGLGRHEMMAARAAGAHTVLTHHLPGLGYICRRGTLMQEGARACDGLPAARKCTVCVLQSRRMPPAAGRLVGSLPIALSHVLGRLPGRAGTMCGLPAGILEQQTMQRDLARACDAIVVLNDAARTIIDANGAGSQLVVNRLGHSHPNVDRRSRTPAASPVRFGFVGRLHETKGVFALVRAVSRIPRNVRFSLEVHGIVQSAAEARVLADLRAIAGEDPRVRFHDAVPTEQVVDLLAGLDVLCSPSTGFENGPTVAIEAIAAGTPVLGTALGNLRELIDDGVNGRLVAPNDPDALAVALTEIATDPFLVDRWRAHLPPARTMTEVAADYATLYEQIGAGRPAATATPMATGAR